MADPFSIGDKVTIDGRGLGIVTGKFDENLLNVRIDGTDHIARLRAERLKKTEMEDQRKDLKKRFVTVEEGDVADKIKEQENRNTSQKTHYDLKLLKQFLKQPSINEPREIFEIPPSELCILLSKFCLSVRKPDGTNYEPSSLRGFLCSFERHLKGNNYLYSLTTGIEFYTLRQTLKSKQKELKKTGKGNLPCRAEPMSDDEIEKLWETGQFGHHSPRSIINTLWFFSTIHFGLRGNTEHRNMCWGDIKLCTDINGREYLEFNERQTKTRTGENVRDTRKVKPKMWDVPTNPNRCPIVVYKRFRELRPVDYSTENDPFYIGVHTQEVIPKSGQPWFRRQPIGTNTISTIMKKMAEHAQLSTEKRITNHSARKHLVQKLNDYNIPPNQIMQISGHKNIQSVNTYSSISENQHRQISTILNHPSASSSHPIPQISDPVPHPKSPQPGPSSSQISNINSSSTVTKSAHLSGVTTVFGGNISGGIFNIKVYQNREESPSLAPIFKRRRIIVDSSEDSQ